MTRRAHIKDRTKLASVLCIVLEIPHEHQLAMHEEHVLSLVEWDHYPIRKESEGSDLFSNLRPLLLAQHGEKTAKRDIPEIAKGKRLRRSEAEHKATMTIPNFPADMTLDEVERASAARFKRRARIASRPFDQGKRKLQSGNNLKRRRP